MDQDGVIPAVQFAQKTGMEEPPKAVQPRPKRVVSQEVAAVPSQQVGVKLQGMSVGWIARCPDTDIGIEINRQIDFRMSREPLEELAEVRMRPGEDSRHPIPWTARHGGRGKPVRKAIEIAAHRIIPSR
jgi:hypothetical protein